MIDDEVELRPVLRRLAHVAHVRVLEQMRKLLLDLGREQTLVDAHVAQRRIRLAPLHELLVEGIGDLLVIEPPRPLGKMLVRVVADGVALPRIGPVLLDLFLEIVEIAAADVQQTMRKHTSGA